MTIPSTARTRRRRDRAFTLIELLIVMGVIGILSVLTLISMRVIARNAKLAASTNTVLASLGNARALAIRDSDLVLLAFRPRIENDVVVVDLVACRWTGESGTDPNFNWTGTVDRFEPIADFDVRTLSPGIKVAAPSYRTGYDSNWTTQSHLPLTRINREWPGVLIAVMYGPDGTMITSNPRTDASLIWVDFNRDRFLDISITTEEDAFRQTEPVDEPFVTFAPFIAVYDDEAARELKDPGSDWGNEDNYVQDLTGDDGYITELGNRIHFNRYTGVALK